MDARRIALGMTIAAAVAAAASAQPRPSGTVTGLEAGATCYRTAETEEGERCRPSDFQFDQEAGPVSESNRVPLRTKRGDVLWVLRTEVVFAPAASDQALQGMIGGVAGGRARSDAPARESEGAAGGGAASPGIAPMRIPAPQRSQRTSVEGGGAGGARVTQAAAPQIPRCTRNLGTISIQNGDAHAGWQQLNLQPPAGLMRVIIQQSGCFTVVERGAGLDAATRERELVGNGALQRGSNVGAGQLRAADYVILADVVAPETGSSGGGIGAALGGVVGGRLGGVIGGVSARSANAQTTLTLANVRTTESFAAEGNAQNRNITWGGAGFLGGGGAGLGGYTDTEAGRTVTVAFIDAYTQMLVQLGAVDSSISASGQISLQILRTTQVAQLRSRPGGGQVLRNLPTGAIVYALGDRDREWWRVVDENDNEGWMSDSSIEPVEQPAAQ